MKSSWKQRMFFLVAAVGLLGVSASAQSVTYSPDNLQWRDGPPSLPAGAKMVVLRGDPAQAGLFTMRLRFPTNYRVQPHWHTADEHVTVISGKLNVGMGVNFDQSLGKALTPGGFLVMPAEMQHFAWTDEETIIQLHGMGPWRVNYVNREDDPRNR
ncbi:MAG: cupin domain-containing protein [Acidobacteria bacterium]|nr:cupin domain-containing protein [Acidobacteriota bacterium]